MTHQEVLSNPHKLVFSHAVTAPDRYPDLTFKSMKLWYVENGFICISPMRAFNQESCRFMFPYSIAGNIAYECTFDEILPLHYRIPRNSGTVQISTNKLPVPYKKAIGIIYKEINKAIKYHSRILPRTKLKGEYLTNHVFKAAGKLTPAYWYNDTIYMLYVDFRCRRAEYKPLISQQDIMKLYYFVEDQKYDKTWQKSFGFTQQEFIDLLANCTM